MKKIDAALYDRLVTLISSMGFELLGYDFHSQGRQMLFRLYVDSPTGVTADICSQVSHQVSAMLDVEDPIQGRYILEVSSPGIDRPLFKLEHYQKFVGSRVKVRLHSPVGQRRHYQGVLQRVEGETICLLVDDTGQEVMLPLVAIEKANVIGDVRI